jgi:hypothetical protein
MIRNLFAFPALASLALLLPPLLTNCSSNLAEPDGSGPPLRIGSAFPHSLTGAPQIVNVSHYDPKERQRSGASYSVSDVSALKRSGARGLIARCGKGTITDTKCSDFLRATDREGMLIGSYYFILKGVDPVWQADRFVDRIRSIRSSQGLRAPGILMVVDFDSKSTPAEMVRVIDRIEKRTGKVPVVYMENSLAVMARMRAASSSQKRRIAQCPYWMALYSPNHEDRETPEAMLRMYGVWNRIAMWQYGGVLWEHGRSSAKHYNNGRWRSPEYFGNLDRPLERNAFNGSTAQLYGFWNRYAWAW